MNWKDEILKSHKGQTGFFKQIEEEQLKTKTMKLNLEQISDMIKLQNRVIESRLETLKRYEEIDINDYLLKNIKHKIEIGRMALLRLKKYKRKLLQIELMKISNEITFYDFGR